jgi:hypothetical protein
MKIAGDIYVASTTKSLGNEVPEPKDIVDYATKLATQSKIVIDQL